MLPPIPPMGGVPGGPSGFPPPANPSDPGVPTPNGSDISAAALRMVMEIDRALALLGQAVPGMGPWAAKTSMELKAQLGQVISAPPMQQNSAASFPDSSSRL